jgi:hypothetical protein
MTDDPTVIKGEVAARKEIMTVSKPRHCHGVRLLKLRGTITKEAVTHLPRFEVDSSKHFNTELSCYVMYINYRNKIITFKIKKEHEDLHRVFHNFRA